MSEKPNSVEIEVELMISVKVKVKAERRYLDLERGRVATGWNAKEFALAEPITPENLENAFDNQIAGGEGGQIDMFDYACFKAAGIDPRSAGQ